MKFNFDDIKWTTVMEAPENESDVDIQATDYTDDVSIDNVEDIDDGELGAEDYSEEETGEEQPPEEGDDMEDPANDEAPIDGEDVDDTTGEDGDVTNDENPNDEQPDNADGGANTENNKYLINDFIELYNRICEVIEKLHGNKKLNSLRDPVYAKAKLNMEKLKDITYDYITQRFNKESYVFNLYQFNLIIQAMNINTELLSNSFAFREDEKPQKKNKKAK